MSDACTRRRLVLHLRLPAGAVPAGTAPAMIHPYKNPRPIYPLAWLLPDGATVLTDTMHTMPLEDVPDDMQTWASIDTITARLAVGHGEALCWDGRPLRWGQAAGDAAWPVRVLRLVAPQKPEDAVRALVAWRDWLAEYGAAPAGSLGGTGMSLLKGTLRAPLYTNAGHSPPLRFTIGGRQELGERGAPAVFTGTLRQWDMQAAYARTLGRLAYGGWWQHVSSPSLVRRLVSGYTHTMMYVRAAVRIPGSERASSFAGPLPRRPRREPTTLQALLSPAQYPTGCTMQGVWALPELRMAERYGAKIMRVYEAWLHATPPDSHPFAPWLAAVEEGRSTLTGFAATLAKATGNSTWGQFAISGRAQRTRMWRIRDGKRWRRKVLAVPMRGSGNPSQRAPDLAEYVTATVRAELYRGMMQANEDLLCAHTDGLWMGGVFYIQGWRSKGAATRMRLITPQNYAVSHPKERDDKYVVAGIPVPSAASFFEDEWEQLTQERPYAMRARQSVPSFQMD